MTVHLCRDFQTLPDASCPGTNMYVLSAFLHHVMGFTYISDNNFPIVSGSHVIAQGLTGDLTATLNLGGGQEYDVLIPTASYLVTSSDVNRILALRSSDHGRSNSGLFRVTAVNTGSNELTIDYRSTTFPPVEGLPYRIFESELSASSVWSSGSNGIVGAYNSHKIASASRVMLETDEELGSWRVRLCLESSVDVQNTCPQGMTVAPGLSVGTDTNSADFTADDTFLHGPLFYDTTSSLYRGSGVGPASSMVNNDWTTGQWRISIIGEDRLGTTTMVTRNVSLPTSASGWLSFGIPDDEDRRFSSRLTEPEQARRLFVVGHASPTGTMDWRCGFSELDSRSGLMWSPLEKPLSCVASSYVSVMNSRDDMRDSIHADDSPFGGKTTLLDVELIGGTLLSNRHPLDGHAVGPFEFDARRIGILPFLRQGRSNFVPWTLTSGSNFTWLHMENGVFMEWGGPAPSGSVLSASDSHLVQSASHVNGTGFQLSEVNNPGQDPLVDSTVNEKDIDANRFKKTYSFFRQEPRLVGITRGGSNPARSSRS